MPDLNPPDPDALRQLNVAISHRDHERLAELARADDRSVAATVRSLIREEHSRRARRQRRAG